MDRGRLTKTSKSLAITLGLVVAASSMDAAIGRVGAEYSVLGPQVGDQFLPDMAFGNDGGYLVWQGNNADSNGLGIRATRLDGNLNVDMGSFRVNDGIDGDQQRPVVALLEGGGAAFAWESQGDIHIRFISPDGQFEGAEQKVNAYVQNVQKDPAIATLDNGNVAVVWSSLDQDGDMQGIYGQLFDRNAEKIGAEFFVNQSVFFNQRSPSVAPLNEGDFVVAWVSEEFRGNSDQTDVNGRVTDPAAGGERYKITTIARIFDENGLAVSDELQLGKSELINANPTIVGLEDGFMAFYSGRNNVEKVSTVGEIENGWDIYGQQYSELGEPIGEAMVVNEHLYGDQVVPSAVAFGDGVFVAWTSLGQDGDQEGVYGRVIGGANGSSSEFQVNSLSRNRQLLPSVSADDEGNALVVWSGFKGGADSFDLQGQKYSLGSTLPALEQPFVFSSGYWSIGVSWPTLDGVNVDSYELYLDGAQTPIVTSGNFHTFSGLNAGSEHTVELVYVLPDGSRSPRSEAGSGSTWGRDENADLLPDDWQRNHFGVSSIDWPSASADSDGDGVTNIDELFAGTNPADPASLLETEVVKTDAGLKLEWNTQAGAVYQVQVTTDIGSWFDTGTPRLAVSTSDSISIVNDQGIAVYRVVRLR